MFWDLGVVHEIANVEVNGKPLGIAWKSPYRIEVTGALRPGINHVKIAVTNIWVNRLIGDAQPDVKRKYTFTDIVPYKSTDPLMPSGLLGPIKFISVMKTLILRDEHNQDRSPGRLSLNPFLLCSAPAHPDARNELATI